MDPDILPTHIGPMTGGSGDALAVDILHWRGLSLMLLFDRKRVLAIRFLCVR